MFTLHADLDEIRQSFDEDGYVCLRGFLTPEQVKTHLQHGLKAVQCAHQDLPNLATEFSRLAVKGLHKHSAWFATLLYEGAHIRLLSDLLGDDLVPGSSALFDRAPGGTEGINPHIDAVGRPFDPRAGITLWIALDPMDEENGCVYYARGSHRVQHASGLDIAGYDESLPEAQPMVVQPGDAVVHHAQTVHWSGANATKRTRRALTFFYFGASAPGPSG